MGVKIVYKDKGYSSVGWYGKYSFIEGMILGEGESWGIREVGIDNFSKGVVGDVERGVGNGGGSERMSMWGRVEGGVEKKGENG